MVVLSPSLLCCLQVVRGKACTVLSVDANVMVIDVGAAPGVRSSSMPSLLLYLSRPCGWNWSCSRDTLHPHAVACAHVMIKATGNCKMMMQIVLENKGFSRIATELIPLLWTCRCLRCDTKAEVKWVFKLLLAAEVQPSCDTIILPLIQIVTLTTNASNQFYKDCVGHYWGGDCSAWLRRNWFIPLCHANLLCAHTKADVEWFCRLLLEMRLSFWAAMQLIHPSVSCRHSRRGYRFIFLDSSFKKHTCAISSACTFTREIV